MEKSNWYSELQIIDKNENIIGIAVKPNEDDTKFSKKLKDFREILDYDFDDGYGATYGSYFTAWTKNRVYFPRNYDGSESICSVPRNPCSEATKHIGGG